MSDGVQDFSDSPDIDRWMTWWCRVVEGGWGAELRVIDQILGSTIIKAMA